MGAERIGDGPMDNARYTRLLRALHPNAVRVMRARGIDISGHRAKHLRELATLARRGVRAVQLYCVNLSGIEAVRAAVLLIAPMMPSPNDRARSDARGLARASEGT